MSEERCVVCGELISEEPSFDTVKIKVLLDKVSDIKDFVNLATKCKDDIVVKSGYYSVNAKSIMGLFSLDLTKPLRVEFYGNIPNEVKEGMKKFIVD